jgi:uncharacterized protein (UPF0262 family)
MSADDSGAADDGRHRIARIEIDETSLAPASPDALHERRVAILDILEANWFRLVGASAGPYDLRLAGSDGRLVFEVRDLERRPVRAHVLSLTPFRRVIRDYFIVCESYRDAMRHATPAQIEAVDMGRRGLHNEGSELLTERLKDKVEMDFDTARRLFTLVCALHRPR